MADADYDFPPELLRLQREFLEAEERWAEAARRGDASAVEAAYQETHRLGVELSRNGWLAAQDNRHEARMALRRAARD